LDYTKSFISLLWVRFCFLSSCWCLPLLRTEE